MIEHREKFRNISHEDVEKIARISNRLRKEREISFYGDVDFIPTEEYTADEAREAMERAAFVIRIARKVIGKQNSLERNIQK